MKYIYIILGVFVLLMIVIFLTPAWKLFGDKYYTNPDSYVIDNIEASTEGIEFRVFPLLQLSRFEDYSYEVDNNVLIVSIKFKPATSSSSTEFKDIWIPVNGENIDKIQFVGNGNTETHLIEDY